MSRGYWTFQRAVMAEVERAGGLASTEQLREAFPRQARDKSLHRTIRSLERVGAVEVVTRPGHVLGDRLVVLIFGHSDGDRELIRQTAELQGWVAWLAREPGLPVPKRTPEIRAPSPAGLPTRAGAEWTLNAVVRSKRPSDAGDTRGVLAYDDLPNPNVVFDELEDVPRTRRRAC